MAQRPTSIHVNPKFVGAHFNPNFLQRPPQMTKILINPNFKPPLPVEPPPELCAIAIKPPPPPEPAPPSAIIKNTRRSLIRASATSRLNVQTPKSYQPSPPRPPQQKLIKLGNNKIVNANYLIGRQHKENEQIKNATISIIQSKKLRRRIADRGKDSVYKLDRRDVPINKKKIVSKFSLKRVDARSPKKAAIAGAKT